MLILIIVWRVSETFPSWDLILRGDTIFLNGLYSSLIHDVMWRIMTNRTWHALSWSQIHQLGSLVSNKLQQRVTWRLKTWLFLLRTNQLELQRTFFKSKPSKWLRTCSMVTFEYNKTVGHSYIYTFFWFLLKQKLKVTLF